MAEPIVHFEIPADDLKRAQAFYQKVLGWRITPWKNDKMEYWSVVTKDDAAAPGINGGLMPRVQNQPLTIYATVSSIDETLKKIVAAGGSVCMPKDEIGAGMGWIAIFKDTEGNIIGLHETAINMYPAKAANKPVKKSAPKKKAAKKKK